MKEENKFENFYFFEGFDLAAAATVVDNDRHQQKLISATWPPW